MVPPLADGDVHIWCERTEGAGSDRITAALTVLSAAEQERAARFRRETDRRDFALAHALVRRTLSRYGRLPPERWTFVANEFGKPSIAARAERGGDALVFNLSHTEGFVACGLAREGDIGIDVETVDRDVDAAQIADRYFGPAEAACIAAGSAGERNQRFVELWTLKEAYIKAVGHGLSHPLDSFTFTREALTALRFEAPPDTEPSDWHFALFAPTERHRMAIAAHRLGAGCRISAWDSAGAPVSLALLSATGGVVMSA